MDSNLSLLGQAYELKGQFFDFMKPSQSTIPVNSIKIGFQMYLKNLTYFEDMVKAMNNWEE
jgi:transposase